MYSTDGSENKPSDQEIAKAVSLIIVIFALVWFFWLGGWEMQTDNLMDKTYKKVSSDFVDEYEITKRQGDKAQICLHAGLVAAGYLQEKNESKYQEWKVVEKADCAKAYPSLNF